MVQGRTRGIDATTLEANAAMRSIVRRDMGEAYDAWLTQLAEASGIATPTRAELARFDRPRKKNESNDDWTHPQDPDAKITKMKGRTHVAHKAEHAVDLETGAIVGVRVQDVDDGDTTTMVETLITAAEQVEAVLPADVRIAEIVGDKGRAGTSRGLGLFVANRTALPVPRVSLPAPAAPRSAATCRRTAAGLDVLPPAGASSTWQASRAGPRSSPAAAGDS